MKTQTIFIHRGPEPRDAARLLAIWLQDYTLTTDNPIHLALSGGRSPITLFECLTREFHDAIPWDRFHFWQVDERWVPFDHPASNAHLIHRLLLQPLAVKPTNIHFIDTTLASPERAARTYEQTIVQSLQWNPTPAPLFDIVVLGIGPDGHTASLFPNAPTLAITDRLVTVAQAPSNMSPTTRITLTLTALNHARHALFFVIGKEKAAVVQEIWRRLRPSPELPASMVHPLDSVHWFVDDATASPFA